MIPIAKEPDEMGLPEDCCFCNAPTQYWNTDKDVPVCEGCALTHTLENLPSKEEWVFGHKLH